MQVVYERCCGLDVHKETVVACVIVPGPDGQPHKETRTFNTLTENLQDLAEWLRGQQVSAVAMESTGVYPGLSVQDRLETDLQPAGRSL